MYFHLALLLVALSCAFYCMQFWYESADSLPQTHNRTTTSSVNNNSFTRPDKFGPSVSGDEGNEFLLIGTGERYRTARALSV